MELQGTRAIEHLQEP